MKNAFVAIHGHFYQPPRESPWLEIIDAEESAHPFHDWNERITAECYRPNAHARIRDGKGKIFEIVNNYSLLNFNFGPTLLPWLEKHFPLVCQRVLEADREVGGTATGEAVRAPGDEVGGRAVPVPRDVAAVREGVVEGHHHPVDDRRTDLCQLDRRNVRLALAAVGRPLRRE